MRGAERERRTLVVQRTKVRAPMRAEAAAARREHTSSCAQLQINCASSMSWRIYAGFLKACIRHAACLGNEKRGFVRGVGMKSTPHSARIFLIFSALEELPRICKICQIEVAACWNAESEIRKSTVTSVPCRDSRRISRNGKWFDPRLEKRGPTVRCRGRPRNRKR
jgi:hypothetical protein